MTLIVEDGTGVEGAQTYSSVAFADSYFTVRGVSTWTGTQDQKEYALIAGTEYIDLRWRGELNGKLLFPDTQWLLFPRSGVVDDQGRPVVGIPEILKRATAEYALISLTQTLMSNPSIDETGTVLLESTEVVGPITETKKYQAGFIRSKPYPKADGYMLPLIRGAGSGGVYV